MSDIKGDSGIKRIKAAAAIYDLLRQWEVEVRHEAWGRGERCWSGVGQGDRVRQGGARRSLVEAEGFRGGSRGRADVEHS